MHRRRALHHALRILGAIGRRTLPRRGKEVNLPFVQQVVEVVQKVGCGVTVLGDKDMHAPGFGHGRRGIKRKSAADQLFEVDGSTPVFIFAAQSAEGFRPGGLAEAFSRYSAEP